MTNPDAAESEALTVARAIGQQAVELYTLAHVEGIRNGMEAGAQIIAQAAEKIADNYELDTVWRATVSAYLGELRDFIRLAALQMPDHQATTDDGSGR